MHICEPVRWRNSIDALAAHLPDAHFLEVGPRAVLDICSSCRGWEPRPAFEGRQRPQLARHIKGMTAEIRHES